MRYQFSKYFLAILYFFEISTLHSEEYNSNFAVTYEFSGGRLGDNLLSYLHAKWISYKYEIPLLYKPFPYSNELVLDDEEIRFSPHLLPSNKKIVYLGRGQTVNLDTNVPTLYIVPYFPEAMWERKNPRWPYFEVNWDDPGFKDCIREMIKPKKKLELCEVQKDKVNVALHVRSGGEFQPDKTLRSGVPLKAPPTSFFIEQLETICRIFSDEKVHAHIFTDDSNPKELAEEFMEYFDERKVVFTYRETGNRYDKNVLEDLFSLLQFDCLIRPESNFSMIASFLADYKVLIYPDEATYIRKTLYINEVVIQKKL